MVKLAKVSIYIIVLAQSSISFTYNWKICMHRHVERVFVFFLSIIIYIQHSITTLYKGYMNSLWLTRACTLTSYFTLAVDCLHFDLVLVTIGVHLEVFIVVMMSSSSSSELVSSSLWLA